MTQIRQNPLLGLASKGKEVFVETTKQRRLSIRATAIKYGLPPRVVSRAIWSGELPAIRTTTETGRERIYILNDDAEKWFSSLTLTNESSVSVGGSR